jgi:hypothetical protein
MKRTNVSFPSEGNILKGLLYHPDTVSKESPSYSSYAWIHRRQRTVHR